MNNGTIFIDRDGDLFAYILDYLRTGKLLLPENFRELARLREEVSLDKEWIAKNSQIIRPNSTSWRVLWSSCCPSTISNILLAPQLLRQRPALSETLTTQQWRLLQQKPTLSMRLVGKGMSDNGEMLKNLKGGFITLGYRGTFAFGRDGQVRAEFRW